MNDWRVEEYPDLLASEVDLLLFGEEDEERKPATLEDAFTPLPLRREDAANLARVRRLVEEGNLERARGWASLLIGDEVRSIALAEVRAAEQEAQHANGAIAAD